LSEVRTLEELRAAGYALGPFVSFVSNVIRTAIPKAAEPASRRRSYWISIATAYGSLVALYLPGARYLPLASAIATSVACGSWLLLIAALGYVTLPLVRRPTKEPLDHYSLANGLTIWRLASVPMVLALIVHAHELRPIGNLAFAFYVTSVATDILDGMIARATKTETDFGRAVDPLADVLVQMAVVYTLAVIRAVPWWFILAVTLRYTVAPIGALGILLLRGPFRIYPTLLGKVSGLMISFTASWIVLRETVGPAWTFTPYFQWLAVATALVAVAQTGVLVYHGVQEMRGKGTAPHPSRQVKAVDVDRAS